MPSQKKSNFISSLRDAGLNGINAIQALSAKANEYRSLGYNPEFVEAGQPAGRDPLLPEDFVDANAVLTPDQVFKVILLSEMVDILLGAPNQDAINAATEQLKAFTQIHFAQGNGPLSSILYSLKP